MSNSVSNNMFIGTFTFTEEFMTIYKNYFIKSFRDKLNYFIPEEYNTWICLSLDKHENLDSLQTHIEEYSMDSNTAIHFMHIKKYQEELSSFCRLFETIKEKTGFSSIIYKKHMADIFGLTNKLIQFTKKVNLKEHLNDFLTMDLYLSDNGVFYAISKEPFDTLLTEITSDISRVDPNNKYITNDNITLLRSFKNVDLLKLIEKMENHRTDTYNDFNIVSFTINPSVVTTHLAAFLELTSKIKDDKDLLYYTVELDESVWLKDKMYRLVTDSQLNRMFQGRDGYTLVVPVMIGHAHPIIHPALFPDWKRSGTVTATFWKEYNTVRMLFVTSTEDSEYSFECVSIKPKVTFFLPEDELMKG